MNGAPSRIAAVARITTPGAAEQPHDVWMEWHDGVMWATTVHTTQARPVEDYLVTLYATPRVAHIELELEPLVPPSPGYNSIRWLTRTFGVEIGAPLSGSCCEAVVEAWVWTRYYRCRMSTSDTGVYVLKCFPDPATGMCYLTEMRKQEN